MRANLPLFPNPVLYAVLAVSIATNAIFIGRRVSIDWHRFVHRAQAVPAIDDADHVRGPASAPVTMVVYADFQCPFSARFHKSLSQLEASDPGVTLVYRHLPLDDLHPMAAPAAEASECAAEQGRFWEYADALFQRQAQLDGAVFPVIAAGLKLDGARFAECMSAGRYRQRVRRDLEVFPEGHLAGTPTSFVNGRRFEGELSVENLRKAVSEARQQAAIPAPAAPPTGS
jgi:protein-disulfide isomerase